MKVRSLELEHFRSFERAKFGFSERTAVIGPNGAGKSNLIEALRLLSIGKSNKTSRLDEAIHFDKPFFRLRLERGNGQKQEVSLFYGTQFEQSQGKERRLLVDNHEASYHEFWGDFPSVLFVPDDLEVVLGSPGARRRYLDSVIWQTDKEFRQSHLELTRVLRERSALLYLLKTNRASPDELTPWNELLTDLSGKVRSRRKDYVAFLGSQIDKIGTVFTHEAPLAVTYQQNSLQPEEAYREEIRLAQNLVGPHRDELVIEFGGRSARRYTSRGQARAVVLVLKLAETAFLRARTKQPPLLLLDDMFSELDESTAGALFMRFERDCQIVASSITPNSLIEGWERVTLK